MRSVAVALVMLVVLSACTGGPKDVPSSYVEERPLISEATACAQVQEELRVSVKIWPMTAWVTGTVRQRAISPLSPARLREAADHLRETARHLPIGAHLRPHLELLADENDELASRLPADDPYYAEVQIRVLDFKSSAFEVAAVCGLDLS